MKLNKLFLFVAVAITTLMSSCSSDDYAPGQPAGKDNVYFADGQNVTLEFTQKTFDVILERTDATSALSVPVEVVAGEDVFTLSNTTAEFAAGSKTATITVTVPEDMKLNNAYQLTLRIPEQYTDPYKNQESYPIYSVNVVKEDYEFYKLAAFIDGFWYDDTNDENRWPVAVYYSPSQKLYRIKGLYEDGYDFYYKLNEDTKVVTVTDSEGKALSKWASGLVHSSYGAVSCDTTAATFKYIEEGGSKYIYLPFKWVVSAGSFGIYACYLVFAE